jgi:RNA polymerase sigma-70 factor (ECF subfamily)
VYEDNKQLLLRYCLRITGSLWDAEDLLQDALLKLMRALEADPARPVTKAFLYRIAVNSWKDRHKRRRLHEEPLNDRYEDQPSCEDPLRTRELLEQLAHRLSPRSTVILLLSDVFSFTAGETAELLQSSEEAVQVTLSRARTRLKKLARLPEDRLNRAEAEASEWSATAFDQLVDAFRRREPKAICRAYFTLRRQGLQVSRIRHVNGKLHFYFQDPDGNLFMVASSQ